MTRDDDFHVKLGRIRSRRDQRARPFILATRQRYVGLFRSDDRLAVFKWRVRLNSARPFLFATGDLLQLTEHRSELVAAHFAAGRWLAVFQRPHQIKYLPAQPA